MTTMEMLKEGFALMGVGMGVVFSFLILLVFCLQLSAKFFERFGHLFPEPVAPTSPAPEDTDLTANIAVAVAAAARQRARAAGN